MFSVLGVLAVEAALAVVFVVAGALWRARPVSDPRSSASRTASPSNSVPSDSVPSDLDAADRAQARGILRVAVPLGLAVFLLLPLLDLPDWKRAWMISAPLGATAMLWGALMIELTRPSRLHGIDPAPEARAPRRLRRLVLVSTAVLGILLLLGWASGSSGTEVGKNEAAGLVYFHAGTLAFLEPWPGSYFARPALTALLCLVLLAAAVSVATRRNRGLGGAPGAAASVGVARLATAFLGLGVVVPLAQTALMVLLHPVLLPGFLLELQILAACGVPLAAWTAVEALREARRALPRASAEPARTR